MEKKQIVFSPSGGSRREKFLSPFFESVVREFYDQRGSKVNGIFAFSRIASFPIPLERATAPNLKH